MAKYKQECIFGIRAVIEAIQQEKEIDKVPILPESSVTKTFTNCIYEADNGIIWVGTREGFYCFNEKEKKKIKRELRRKLEIQ